GGCQPNRLTGGEKSCQFYYPSVKNQRFLTPPLTRGGFWCGAKLKDKLQFEAAEPNRAVMLDD
ncbi:MAG: hypothetical protein IKW50_01455, partial [Oscillospiraceae bacterium]|nr:hypothetical protein [Oscillospiraceae bacterium]